ncbi:unnamed protein product [Brassica oleracea var. botrytis]|uniref:(rape) hypothetical protein n=1 Tax=Brassica napus TaxID=3708 RepID=A0A816ITE2_BRANA|nr:unnamed protein product [Brassica napus]
MWLSPATLELYHITWDDSASLLEKQFHTLRSLMRYAAVTSYQRPFGSQKKILGIGRRCRHLQHLAPSLNSCNGSSQTSHLTSRFGEDEGGGTQSNSTSFSENVLLPEEEQTLMSMFILVYLMVNMNHIIITSTVFCLDFLHRYLLQEEKRGKTLDSVANFHLQNVAMVERINWMADRSKKSIHLSGGIVVKYVYRLENIEYYA